MPTIRLLQVTIAFVFAFGITPIAANAQNFSDLPSTHQAFGAVQFLREKGVLQGYPDGTFKPDQVVTRAEAIKMIVGPTGTDVAGFTTSPFSDVPEGSWYLPYVEAGRTKLGIVQGPPNKTTFRPGDPVIRAEFLKFFLLANKVDAQGAWADLLSPLSNDVKPADWHYPFFRYAIGSSMVQVDTAGSLMANSKLTRGQISLLMYRWYMYKDGRRTQALLSEAESEIINVLSMVEKQDLISAEQAATRGVLASRGALSSKPDAGVVKGAVKVAEGFNFITKAYKAGSEQRFDDAIALAGQGWQSGVKAQEFSPELKDVVTQMQQMAKTVADAARTAKAGG